MAGILWLAPGLHAVVMMAATPGLCGVYGMAPSERLVSGLFVPFRAT